MKLKYTVINNNYKTVKEVLKAYFNISDRLLVKLKKHNKINLNKTLAIGDIVEINMDFEEANSNIVPTKMDLNIIYEDDCYIIINKPAGIPVHPSMDHYEDSLSNGLKHSPLSGESTKQLKLAAETVAEKEKHYEHLRRQHALLHDRSRPQ